MFCDKFYLSHVKSRRSSWYQGDITLLARHGNNGRSSCSSITLWGYRYLCKQFVQGVSTFFYLLNIFLKRFQESKENDVWLKNIQKKGKSSILHHSHPCRSVLHLHVLKASNVAKMWKSIIKHNRWIYPYKDYGWEQNGKITWLPWNWRYSSR